MPHFQRPRPKVFQHDVGLRDKLLEQFDPVGLSKIQRDRLLVPRLAQPDQAVAAIGDGAELAQRIPDFGCSTLITSAPKSAGSSAEGRCHESRNIEDAQTIESTGWDGLIGRRGRFWLQRNLLVESRWSRGHAR